MDNWSVVRSRHSLEVLVNIDAYKFGEAIQEVFNHISKIRLVEEDLARIIVHINQLHIELNQFRQQLINCVEREEVKTDGETN